MIGVIQIYLTRKLLTDIYAYIFVCDDDIFPNLCILVYNAVPLTNITNYELTITIISI